MIFLQLAIPIGCNYKNMQQEQFVQLIQQHEGLIYKVARLYAHTLEDRKDLYQEIVYQLWKSFDSFQGRSKLSTWMYRVALNTAIGFLNRQNRRVGQTQLPDEVFMKMDESHPELEERVQVLYQHIKQLNIVDKGLILLFLEGKSYEEMADITGFSLTNVGTRLGRIKNRLKTKIQKSAWN